MIKICYDIFKLLEDSNNVIFNRYRFSILLDFLDYIRSTCDFYDFWPTTRIDRRFDIRI